MPQYSQTSCIKHLIIVLPNWRHRRIYQGGQRGHAPPGGWKVPQLIEVYKSIPGPQILWGDSVLWGGTFCNWVRPVCLS